MQHEQRAVHDGGVGCGDSREVIDSLVEAGEGVDILAKAYAYALQEVDDALVGEILGAVEGHVLQEMREAVLVILLKDGADFLSYVELGGVLRELIVADDVGEAVAEAADDHGGVRRERRERLGGARERHRSQTASQSKSTRYKSH